MKGFILVTVVIVSNLCSTMPQIFLLSNVNIISHENEYITQVMANSMKLALQSCQQSFKWERWNCPSSDFFSRSASKSMILDAEDSYVRAIITAAVLYTITKNCSNGTIAKCNTCSDNNYSPYCSDQIAAAKELFAQHFITNFANDVNGKIAKHNYKAVTNLLEHSLVEKCICPLAGFNGKCSTEICLQVLKSFEDIAADIRLMYDERVELYEIPENSLVLWDNILDALVFMKASPNYCDIDALPHWNGMRNRLCATTLNDKNLTIEDHKRCGHLCIKCGYRLQKKNIVSENPCNCKFTSTLQIQCDECVTTGIQHLCY